MGADYLKDDRFMQTMFQTVLGAFPDAKERRDPLQAPPLTLAYIGDTLYDLFVRTQLAAARDLTARDMHRRAAKFVCAAAQAAALTRMMPQLTPTEQDVFRRGRNAHMGTVPKHAAIGDYRQATGLEALLGWLYLSGQDERLVHLMQIALEEL